MPVLQGGKVVGFKRGYPGLLEGKAGSEARLRWASKPQHLDHV